MSKEVEAAEAVTAIVKLLQNVSANDRERVIRTVATFVGVDLPPTPPRPFNVNNMSAAAR